MDENQKALEIANLEAMVAKQPEAPASDPTVLENLHNLNSTEGVDASDED